MNVDHIYHLQRDDAFAQQFSAAEYQTFVAMPFTNRGGYPERQIRAVLATAHERANALLPDRIRRRFAPLRRIDDVATGTITITEEIIRQVLFCHFFWGDLTGCNFGVVLETGLALALKPNERVLLFTQDGTHSLHFDLSVTRIEPYTETDLLEKSVKALVQACEFFESEADKYIRFLSSQLTSDAIRVMNVYGQRWRDWHPGSPQPSIFHRVLEHIDNFSGPTGRVVFNDAVRELSRHRLLWTDYKSNASPGADHYGLHATKLGWRVIEHIWQHDAKMREPPNAPTGPTLSQTEGKRDH